MASIAIVFLPPFWTKRKSRGVVRYIASSILMVHKEGLTAVADTTPGRSGCRKFMNERFATKYFRRSADSQYSFGESVEKKENSNGVSNTTRK